MSILSQIGIFLLFLSPLVFFHELGHFLFARLFGVKVEQFSIGFGKKIFGFKKGDTEYKFALIPLGGYVKMFGDDPTRKDEISPEERSQAFNFKSKWARFWIVMGGPLANFILAFFIYFGLIANGGKVKNFKISEITPEARLSQLGFKTGDILKKLNGEYIYSQEDIFFLEKEINEFVVIRDGVDTSIKVNESIEKLFEDYIQNSKYLIENQVFNLNGNSFYLSKSKDFLKDTSLNELILSDLSEIHLFDSDKKYVDSFAINSSLMGDLYAEGYYSHDLKIAALSESFPAKAAGLLEDDILIKFNNVNLLSFYDIQKVLKEVKETPTQLSFIRDGKVLETTLSAKLLDGSKDVYQIGIRSFMKVHDSGENNLESPGLIKSIKMGVFKTYLGMKKTFEVVIKLFTGDEKVMKSVGGPVAIANMASQTFMIGWKQFLSLMAILSINLGIFNLLPVPVLDGGHIVLLGVEGILGRPLSEKKLMIVQQTGLFLLLSLMFIVIVNDIIKFF